MPFCCRKKSKLNLQIPRAWKCGPLQEDRQEGFPRCLRKREHDGGSLLCTAVSALCGHSASVSVHLYLGAGEGSMELMGRARLLAVTAGQGYGSDPYVKLADADLVSLPFLSVPSGRRLITRRAVVRAWVGYTGETFQKDAGEELVYITPDGTFWGCRESDPGYTLIIQPMDSACSMIEYGNSGNRGSVHIMKDGEVRV